MQELEGDDRDAGRAVAQRLSRRHLPAQLHQIGSDPLGVELGR